MIQEPLSHPNAPYRAFALLLASECVHRIHWPKCNNAVYKALYYKNVVYIVTRGRSSRQRRSKARGRSLGWQTHPETSGGNNESALSSCPCRIGNQLYELHDWRQRPLSIGK